MTRIKTSKWPAALFAGLAAVLLSSAASAMGVKIWTVDCSDPEQTIANALSHAKADRVDEIHFTGICTEELDFNTGNVTITGDDFGEIVGHVAISGASNVILDGFDLTVADGDTGVEASMGASVRITGVHIGGTGEETLGIHVMRGSVARIDHVTVTVAGIDATALLVKEGATARLSGGSTFTSGPGGAAIEVSDASSLHQGGDTDTVVGQFDIVGSSYARLRNVILEGNLGVSRLSGLRMQNTSADNVDLSWGSFARLDGGSEIPGGVSCSQGSQVQDRGGVGVPPSCMHP